MPGGLLILLIIPIGVLIAAACISYDIGKSKGLGLLIICLIFSGFTALMFFGMQRAPGMKEIPYLLALWGLCAPAGVGILFGGWSGWNERRGNEKN